MFYVLYTLYVLYVLYVCMYVCMMYVQWEFNLIGTLEVLHSMYYIVITTRSYDTDEGLFNIFEVQLIHKYHQNISNYKYVIIINYILP